MPRLPLSLLLGLTLTLTLCWIAPGALYGLLPFQWHRTTATVRGRTFHVPWSHTLLQDYAQVEDNDKSWAINAPPKSLPSWFTPPDSFDSFIREDTHVVGFPFRALICQPRYTLPPPRGFYVFHSIRGGFELFKQSERFGIIPLTPIWPGLLANLALWSTLSYLSLLTIQTLRTRRAHKRKHLCPRCNYDRTGLTPSTKCPECGTLPN